MKPMPYILVMSHWVSGYIWRWIPYAYLQCMLWKASLKQVKWDNTFRLKTNPLKDIPWVIMEPFNHHTSRGFTLICWKPLWHTLLATWFSCSSCSSLSTMWGLKQNERHTCAPRSMYLHNRKWSPIQIIDNTTLQIIKLMKPSKDRGLL